MTTVASFNAAKNTSPMAIILWFVCAIAASSARANDSTAEMALGGLAFTKSDAILMDSEDLYISRDRVRVKYRFTNTMASPIHTLVAFPLPDIPPGTDIDEADEAILGDPVSTLKFKTTVDGQPFALQVIEQAFFKRQDVSVRLSALDIPLNRFTEGFNAAINRLPKTDRDRLMADGLIREEGVSDHQIWAGLWALRRTLTRHQTFPAHRTVTVEHEYVPMAGGSVGGGLNPQFRTQADSAAYFTEKRRKYCIDDDWLVSFDKKLSSQKEGEYYSEIWLGYVLKTGANWKGPIGDFHLIVDKGKPDSLVSFCAEGVKKISPTQFEARRANFTPTDDLDILIIDWQH
jgi:Domain of unknown function (DUF4424)